MNEENNETQENAPESLQSMNPSQPDGSGEAIDSKKPDKQKSRYM